MGENTVHFSTDSTFLDMLHVQNRAIFTDERPKVPLLQVLTKYLIQQDISGTASI